MTPAQKHNQIVSDFVAKAGAAATDSAELMVMLESILLGAMLINMRPFGCSPAVACGLVEAAIQRATERFTEKVEGGPR